MASTHHHRSRSSTIVRIPYELLAQIFELCCLSQRVANYSCTIPSKHKAPLLLLGVCRKWRDCALSTGSLWSRLCIGRVSSENSVLHAIEAKTWLDRAGSIPLSIDLCYARYADENIQDAVDHAMKQIFTPARVWKVVFLEICGPIGAGSTHIDAILNTVLCHAPVLERFSFDITGYWRAYEDPPNKTIAIGHAPSLSFLSIAFNSRILKFRFSFFGGLFYNVRDLSLHQFTSNHDCLDILHQCPNVEVLSLTFRTPKCSVSRTAILTLSKLHALDVHAMIDDSDFGGIAEIFDALCTPALRELSLDSSLDFSTTEPPHWPNLAQFLARSQPPLKNLTLFHQHGHR